MDLIEQYIREQQTELEQFKEYVFDTEYVLPCPYGIRPLPDCFET